MKIVHIAPSAPYNDYWGYQDNLLPKYQKKAGNDVTIIITNTMHSNGKIVEIEPCDYILDDGVRVIRLPRKKYCHKVLTNMNARLDVYPYLQRIQPDFVFVHGLIGNTINDVVSYKKKINSNCVIVRDNHLDYNNAGYVNGWKTFIIRAYQRHINKRTLPFVSKVYGVTPWRKTFAEDYYGIPKEKTDVLIMGADDDKLDLEHKPKVRARIREKYEVGEDDYLIVTGGKIDALKNTDKLMEACRELQKVKLLIFGNVVEDMQDRFQRLLAENKNLIFVGWLPADGVYDYFMAADLVAFPGGHSVMWEQACACKVPCLFKYFEGVEHLNNGGNSTFLYGTSVEDIRTAVQNLLFTEEYNQMKQIAQSEATDIYLYSKIAEKSLECAQIRHRRDNT